MPAIPDEVCHKTQASCARERGSVSLAPVSADRYVTLAGRGRKVSAVCKALGLARRNVHRLRTRPKKWIDARPETGKRQRRQGAGLKAQITELPTFGYQRTCALVNRHPANTGAPRVNAKHVYRVVVGHALLLPNAPRRRQSSRPHEGQGKWRSRTAMCAGVLTASSSSATRVSRSRQPSPKTAATARSWTSGLGRARDCRASCRVRCSSKPWRSA